MADRAGLGLSARAATTGVPGGGAGVGGAGVRVVPFRSDSTDLTAETVDNGSKCSSRLAHLCNNPKFSDVTLIVSGQRFYAHKLLLANASDFFEQMLTSQHWQDSGKREVRLQESEDCVPVFSDFLRYIYCGQITLTTQSVLGLLVLADKYNIPDLKDCCSTYMARHLVSSPENNRSVTWYQYAIACNAPELEQACFTYIGLNLDTVMLAPDWGRLDRENLVLLLQRSDVVVESEYAILQAVVRWLCEEEARSVTLGGGGAGEAEGDRIDGETGSSVGKDANGGSGGGGGGGGSDGLSPPGDADESGGGEAGGSAYSSGGWGDCSGGGGRGGDVRASLKAVLPYIRFPMILPEHLCAFEESAFARAHHDILSPYLLSAYRYHALSVRGRKEPLADVPTSQFLYRNYTDDNYSIHTDVVRKAFRSCPRVSSKVERPVSLPVTIGNGSQVEQCKLKVTFYPQGYYTTSLWNGQLNLAKLSDQTRLVLAHRGGVEMREAEVSIVVYAHRNGAHYADYAITRSHVFETYGKLEVENVVDLDRLKPDDSAHIVDGALFIKVFVRPISFGRETDQSSSTA